MRRQMRNLQGLGLKLYLMPNRVLLHQTVVLSRGLPHFMSFHLLPGVKQLLRMLISLQNLFLVFRLHHLHRRHILPLCFIVLPAELPHRHILQLQQLQLLSMPVSLQVLRWQ